MKIGLCSFYNKPASNWGEPCARTMKAYCEQRGYDYIRPEVELVASRSPNWQKPDILLRHLGQYDLLVWVDGDVVITNFDWRIEDVIAQSYFDTDAHFNSDHNYRGGFNNGVMFLRNRASVFDLLLNWRDLHGLPWAENDNDAMWPLVRDAKDLSVTWLPQKLINAYPNIHTDGDWLVHLAGLKNRMVIVRIFCEQYCPWAIDADRPPACEKCGGLMRLKFDRSGDLSQIHGGYVAHGFACGHSNCGEHGIVKYEPTWRDLPSDGAQRQPIGSNDRLSGI
jgi:hypothetical protein